MTIETILRQKGSLRQGSGLAADKEYRRPGGDEMGMQFVGLISEREIVHAFSRYGETAASKCVRGQRPEIYRYGWRANRTAGGGILSVC